jgi:MoxR-like ATPase
MQLLKCPKKRKACRTSRYKEADNMFFAGRENETSDILRSLAEGKNIIISGKFGIGRTALMKHAADIARGKFQFVFVDFSKTAGEVCRRLLASLSPHQKYKRIKNEITYRAGRFMLANIKLKSKKPCVIVLDNIAKLTPQKSAFINYLASEKRFRFAAIVETFLPAEDLLRLRTQLTPLHTIVLKRLNLEATAGIFRHFSQKYGFRWTEEHILSLAKTAAGYPLGAMEFITRERK